MTATGMEALVRAAIWEALARVVGEALPAECGDDLELIGSGLLSSLQLVRVLLEVEQTLADCGADLVLASPQAMSRTQSPFRSVETLVAYCVEQLECSGE